MCHFLHLQVDVFGGKILEFGCFESRHQFLIDMYFDSCYYITTGAKEAIHEYLPVGRIDEFRKWQMDDPATLFEWALNFRFIALRELAIIEDAWRYPSHAQLMAKAAPPKAIR